jgi:ubiquinone/menaquinone biosynthesis C-methylase UbiE/uncharacterized protein YbaR (Trm112 family)
MKKDFVKNLLCPKCQQNNFQLITKQADDLEINEAIVICQFCGKNYLVNHGLVFIYDELSAAAGREIQAIKKEIKLKPLKSDREKRIIDLSRDNALTFLTSQVNLSQQRILELGAANGWLSIFLAPNNYCVALDINDHESGGLREAKNYFNNQIFIERVVSDMVRLPFMDGSFSVVIVCSALHHSSNLALTLSEIYRVLKPGGRLLLINEPSNGLLGGKEKATSKIDLAKGFNEQRYSIYAWRKHLKQANFNMRFYLPGNMDKILLSRGLSFMVKPWSKLNNLPLWLKTGLTLLILTFFNGFFNVKADKLVKK